MTQNELNRFEAVLTERVAELERLTRLRDGITVERSADQLINWTRSRRLPNGPSRFITSTANSTNFETPVQLSAVSKNGTSGAARRAMRTSARSGLPRCRVLHFAFGARKP
jgi:hypothetical protein